MCFGERPVRWVGLEDESVFGVWLGEYVVGGTVALLEAAVEVT
jgi:hypothetical protein